MNTEALVAYGKSILEDAELMNHAIGKNSTPGPLVYDLTGYAGATAGELTKLCKLLADGMLMSMAEHEVHDEDGRPALATQTAMFRLGEAAAFASQLAAALGRVQAAVNGMTYTERDVPSSEDKGADA